MATTTSDSLTDLERRAETTRAELARTVDALHNRVSPSAIKSDVKAYVRDNPLQAAAIAVGAAYPVWRMVSAIPAPVLLIGAGLALTRRDNPTRYGNGFSSRDDGKTVVEGLKEKASATTSQIAGKAQDAVENVRALAADTVNRTTESLASTYDNTRRIASDTLHDVAEQAGDTYVRADEQLSDMIERHPLLVGGAAFALGSILAAAVPVSRQESRIMGETADELRRRSQDLAMQGLHQAKDVAQQVYRTAAEEVREEGFSPEAARRTARAAVDIARDAMPETTGAKRS